MITENDIEESHKRLNEKIASVTEKAIEMIESWKNVNDLSKCQEVSDIAGTLTAAANKQIAKLEAMTKLGDDQLKREIHIFPNLRLISAMMFQIRYLDNKGAVAKYGDIFLAGDGFLYGAGYYNSQKLRLPFTRVELPFGVEIIEVVSDGFGIWYIEKERKKVYYAGKGGDSNSVAMQISLVLQTFNSPIKKIAVGQGSHRFNDNKLNNHLAMIVLENGEVYGYGNNESKTIKPEGSETWIGTPTKVSIKQNQGDAEDLKVLDACVFNCGHKRNAAIFLVEEKSSSGTKHALYGSGYNTTNCMGSDAGSRGSKTDGIKKLFKTYFGAFSGKIFNMWSVTSCNNSSDSSSYVWATFYCTAGASQEESILLASGYGKDGYISQSFDINKDDGTSDTLFGCTLSSNGATIKNVVQLSGTGNGGIVVIRDGNKHLYVGGKIIQKIWNIPTGNTKGFIKATQGTGQYPVEASNFWLYGANTRSSSSNADKCRPYILHYHEGADPGFFHVGHDWASRANSDKEGEHITGGGNSYYSMLPGEERLKSSKGICIMTGHRDQFYSRGFAVYGISADGRYLLYRGYPGTWMWWIDESRLDDFEAPVDMATIPGMPLV